MQSLGIEIVVRHLRKGAGDEVRQSYNEMSVRATIADGEVMDFEFTPRVRRDITADELNALFDEAKARIWGFLQPMRG